MTDTAQMSSFLQKMRAGADNAKDDFVLDDAQVARVVEVLVPQIVTNMPGMSTAGLKCSVTKDDKGWTIRVDRP